MRSHEERFAEAKRQIAARNQAKRLRHGTITAAAAAAACLALLTGVSFAMPGIAAQFRTDGRTGFKTAASMYGGSDALGYIVIGLLAFLLGVCVTILCFRLRQMDREDAQEQKSGEQHGAD